jgi:hypothetical protein
MLVLTWEYPPSKRIVNFTTDGGQHWDTVTFLDNRFIVVDYSFSSFIPPSSFYLFTTPTVLYTSDLRSWTREAMAEGAGTGMMFDTNFGYRIVRGVNQAKELRSTSFGPGAGSFTDRISEWPPDGTTNRVLILDSLHLLRTAGSKLYRSSNKGVDWDTIRPVTAESALYRFAVATKDVSRFYVVGGRDSLSDFLYTNDTGNTWREHRGVTGHRVLRLAEQDSNHLWLMVGRSNRYRPEPDQMIALSAGEFADTLYYTTDQGLSWQKDVTFAGDSIIDIKWASPTHGYVLSFRDSAVKFSRWVTTTLNVSATGGFDRGQLFMHPNPASTEIKFYPSLSGVCELRIYDSYGREAHRELAATTALQSQSIKLPSSLPNGYYLLEVRWPEARSVQGFVISR